MFVVWPSVNLTIIEILLINLAPFLYIIVFLIFGFKRSWWRYIKIKKNITKFIKYSFPFFVSNLNLLYPNLNSYINFAFKTLYTWWVCFKNHCNPMVSSELKLLRKIWLQIDVLYDCIIYIDYHVLLVILNIIFRFTLLIFGTFSDSNDKMKNALTVDNISFSGDCFVYGMY